MSYDHYPMADLGLTLRIEAGRGCPVQIALLSPSEPPVSSSAASRLKSARRLVHELDACMHAAAGVRDFKLDTTTVSRSSEKKVAEFCDAVGVRGYRWRVRPHSTRRCRSPAQDGRRGQPSDWLSASKPARSACSASPRRSSISRGAEPVLELAERLGIETDSASFIYRLSGRAPGRTRTRDSSDAIGRCFQQPVRLVQLHACWRRNRERPCSHRMASQIPLRRAMAVAYNFARSRRCHGDERTDPRASGHLPDLLLLSVRPAAQNGHLHSSLSMNVDLVRRIGPARPALRAAGP